MLYLQIYQDGTKTGTETQIPAPVPCLHGKEATDIPVVNYQSHDISYICKDMVLIKYLVSILHAGGRVLHDRVILDVRLGNHNSICFEIIESPKSRLYTK